MKGFLAVMTLELARRPWDLLVAASAGFLSLLVPSLIGADRHAAGEVRVASACFIAIVVSLVLGISRGATMIGRDLAEGRLGFYFSRPLSAGALWWGKLISSWLLILGIAGLIVLPALLFEPSSWGMWFSTLKPLQSFLALANLIPLTFLLLLVLSHALGVLLRARSLWILPILAAAFFPWLLLINLDDPYIPVAIPVVFLIVLCHGLVLPGLLVGGLMQLRWGRTDLRRGARTLAVFCLTTMLVAALAFAGFASRLQNLRPTDLQHFSMIPAPGGRWVSVVGGLRWFGSSMPASFLLDLETGAWLKTAMSDWGHCFSENGDLAVWAQLRSIGEKPLFALRSARLDDPHPAATVSTVALIPGGIRSLALSPSGRRLAVEDGEALRVFDTRTHDLVAHAPALSPTPESALALGFVGDETLRGYVFREPSLGSPKGELVIYELPLNGVAGLRQTGVIEGVGERDLTRARWSPVTDRLLITTHDRDRMDLTLRDGRTGELLARLQCGSLSGRPAMLADGGFVLVRKLGDGQIALVRYSSEGVEQGLIRFGVSTMLRFCGQLDATRLVVESSTDPWNSLNVKFRLALVDLEAGRILDLGDDLKPPLGLDSLYNRASALTEPGYLLGNLLFLEDHRRIVRVDPDSGAREVLLAPGRE